MQINESYEDYKYSVLDQFPWDLIDIIAPSTGLSVEEVQQLQQQLNQSAQNQA